MELPVSPHTVSLPHVSPSAPPEEASRSVKTSGLYNRQNVIGHVYAAGVAGTWRRHLSFNNSAEMRNEHRGHLQRLQQSVSALKADVSL